MFTPFTLNGQTIKNRIVRSATQDFLFNPDGTATDEYIAVYEELARNDIGLIICGYLRNDDRYAAPVPQGSVDGERYVPGLSRIADTAHRYGSTVYGQTVYTGSKEFEKLDDAKIGEITAQYVKGALTLKKAGFDGVQIHMAHGNYLSRLLEYDRYGDEKRIILPTRIVRDIKAACGQAFTVITKINADSVPLESLLFYVHTLKDAGLDAVELSGSDWHHREKTDTLYYLSQAKAVKASLDIPVILVGGMNSSQSIQKALDEGMDMVSMSRAFLCEPDFVQKLKQGNAVSKCLHCNQCLNLPQKRYKRCVFQPENAFLKAVFQKT